MEHSNDVIGMKDLIKKINEANKAYYCDDNPIITDLEYDNLVDELKNLEQKTGIVFANSPTRHVSGANNAGFRQVKHSKPMLSARKTKSIDEVVCFAAGEPMVLSWKMDGISMILRYKNGGFTQAITRGEEGLIGEDVTHTVMCIPSVPKKIKCRYDLEVRGECVISWSAFELLNRNNDTGHPRNVAASTIRSMIPDKGYLSHIDFFAFELIMPNDKRTTKTEQLDFLAENGFNVVEHIPINAYESKDVFKETLSRFDPEKYPYPVDGIIAEFDDIAYGKSLGATAHHENRMIALKWSDDLYETVFKGAKLSATKTGKMSIVAEFEPVTIDGSEIRRAALNSLTHFERLKLGKGDTLKVYKANMIIPQIAENMTQSGTYTLPEKCPCCGSTLEIRLSQNSIKNLYCPNDDCIARNAQRIARFCDKDAMNISGITPSVLEDLMAFGFIRNYVDLYHLENQRERIITTPGFGEGLYDKITASVEKSRRCHLYQFLTAVGIPLMGPNNARAIDEYFLGSWTDFEKAINNGFSFDHIADVSPSLNRNIYKWFGDEVEGEAWRPVLKEITFIKQAAKVGKDGNPFFNANVAVTGIVNGMNRKDITDLLMLLGAHVDDNVTKNTTYLIVGEHPGSKKLSAALTNGTPIITEGHFAKMLNESDCPDSEEQ